VRLRNIFGFVASLFSAAFHSVHFLRPFFHVSPRSRRTLTNDLVQVAQSIFRAKIIFKFPGGNQCVKLKVAKVRFLECDEYASINPKVEFICIQ
jgi:hypothetical protein